VVSTQIRRTPALHPAHKLCIFGDTIGTSSAVNVSCISGTSFSGLRIFVKLPYVDLLVLTFLRWVCPELVGVRRDKREKSGLIAVERFAQEL
jgi:hypothetical protein